MGGKGTGPGCDSRRDNAGEARVAIPLSLNLDLKLYQSIIKQRQAEAQRYLRSIQSRFSPSQADIETHVLVGRDARSIINFAHEKEFDLIILPSRGRSGINRLLYDRAAEKILRGANCVTLVIRIQENSK